VDGSSNLDLFRNELDIYFETNLKFKVRDIIRNPLEEESILRLVLYKDQALINSYLGNFVIRVYTRPIYTEIDNNSNINDTFYGNYYDSTSFQVSGYTTYHLDDLFPSWSNMLNTSYNKQVYYSGGLQNLQTLGEQQILSICILTNNNNANIGVKNIIVSYK
jgi:hypothetical protein